MYMCHYLIRTGPRTHRNIVEYVHPFWQLLRKQLLQKSQEEYTRTWWHQTLFHHNRVFLTQGITHRFRTYDVSDAKRLSNDDIYNLLQLAYHLPETIYLEGWLVSWSKPDQDTSRPSKWSLGDGMQAEVNCICLLCCRSERGLCRIGECCSAWGVVMHVHNVYLYRRA